MVNRELELDFSGSRRTAHLTGGAGHLTRTTQQRNFTSRRNRRQRGDPSRDAARGVAVIRAEPVCEPDVIQKCNRTYLDPGIATDSAVAFPPWIHAKPDFVGAGARR